MVCCAFADWVTWSPMVFMVHKGRLFLGPPRSKQEITKPQKPLWESIPWGTKGWLYLQNADSKDQLYGS